MKIKDKKKNQGGEGNGLNPAAIFTGGYGRFREFGGCRTRAVTGGSGANGLKGHCLIDIIILCLLSVRILVDESDKKCTVVG